MEEEKQYAALKNQLIEIQLGAEEGLKLLHYQVQREAEKHGRHTTKTDL